ncbi:MAG: rhodanese-like domain-containing protein [Candidatus Ranarchaeia archaeon]|jgi:rhodanese-related sulfurtransferase
MTDFPVPFMIIDVRSREEYVKGHIKGAINLPLPDLDNYLDFLRKDSVEVYCNTDHRSKIAIQFLKENGISATVIPITEYHNYEVTQHDLVSAMKYLTVKPGKEEEFFGVAKKFTRQSVEAKGFMGAKIFRVSTVSFGGSLVQGSYTDIPIQPTKFVLLTYWTNKEAHEEFHKKPENQEKYRALLPFLASMPYEEFSDIMR